MSKYVYDVDELKKQVKGSLCWSDVCRQLGVTVCTFNFKRIQKLCAEHDICFGHFDIKRTFRRNKTQWTAELLLTVNSTASRGVVRNFLKRNKLLKKECYACGLKEVWNGKHLRLEIDHVNGDCCDNRLSNLRMLCPNCHSQTETYKKGKV